MPLAKVRYLMAGYSPNTETSKVVGHIVAVRHASEGDAILGLGNVDRRGNVVSKTTVLVKVEDDQTDMSVA